METEVRCLAFDLKSGGRRGGEAGTLATEGPLDARELDRLVQRLLLLAELAEGHDAVELLVVLAARLAAELVDFVLGRQEKTHQLLSRTAQAIDEK